MYKLLWVGGFAALFASLLGLLVIVWPFWELANHFRPFVLLGVLLLAALSVWIGHRPVGWIAMGLLVFNVLLLIPGLLNRAEFAQDTPQKGRQLKLLTFNIWIRNRAIDDVARVLLKENADFVVLQEITGGQYEKLSKRLSKRYPYRVSCAHKRSCLLAIFSRHDLSNVKITTRAIGNPPLIDATLLDQKGKARLRLLATHISWPFHPNRQREDMNWLAVYISTIKTPLIVAGDFNLSPWSWKMARFQKVTGLRCHTTMMFSWPANRLAPFVQLDHVLTSRSIRAISARTGNRAGSDHLPVIATMRHPS